MWLQIAFYVVTAILSYLLTPKPKAPPAQVSQNAVPQEGRAPTAKTDGPVPVVFGTVWVTPNVVWYGDLGTSGIQECQTTQGGGGKK